MEFKNQNSTFLTLSLHQSIEIQVFFISCKAAIKETGQLDHHIVCCPLPLFITESSQINCNFHPALFFSEMGVFYHEDQRNSSKKCKFFTETLKDAFSNCTTCRRLSVSSPEEEYPMSEIEVEQEIILSAIRSRALEKSRNRSFVLTDSFTWAFSLKTGELFLAPKILQQKDHDDDELLDDEKEEFVSVASCFSCCPSALSEEAFLSVKTNFSRCSSLRDFIEIQDFPKRSILEEFRHCEGWPFGLCRKAILLPPLPKSPSESWSWHKGGNIVKMAQVSTFSTALVNKELSKVEELKTTRDTEVDF